MTQWLTQAVADGVRITPMGDAVQHEDTGCVCRPSSEYLGIRPDGSHYWMTTHHSLTEASLTALTPDV